ncbi:MAG TPA: hypothetical protein VLK36_16055 [Gaiellaceae bacterium]|nr:hypothetical protein [Gaiellaceae bacterium]
MSIVERVNRIDRKESHGDEGQELEEKHGEKATSEDAEGEASGEEGQEIATSLKGRLTFLERLLGGRRPPTGPLTTQEAADAEELRQKSLPNDAGGHEQKDAGDREP